MGSRQAAVARRSHGVLIFTVTRADGGADAGRVRVNLDYAGFAYDCGGGLRRPAPPGRAAGLRAHNPAGTRLPGADPLGSADDVAATPRRGRDCPGPAGACGRDRRWQDGGHGREPAVTVLAATPAPSGSAGSFAATSLSEAGHWTAGGSDGAFTYSYPISVPHVPGGLEPSVSLDYDSQAVDGLTSSTNDQASWIGDGWDYAAGLRRAGLRLLRDRAAGRHQLEDPQRRRLLVLGRHPDPVAGRAEHHARAGREHRRVARRGGQRGEDLLRHRDHQRHQRRRLLGHHHHRRHLLLLRPERAARLRLRRRGDQQHLDRAGLRDLIGAGRATTRRSRAPSATRRGGGTWTTSPTRTATRSPTSTTPRPTTTPRTTAPPPTAPTPRAGRCRRSSTGCGPGRSTAPPRPARSPSPPAPAAPTSRPTWPAPTAPRAT